MDCQLNHAFVIQPTCIGQEDFLIYSHDLESLKYVTKCYAKDHLQDIEIQQDSLLFAHASLKKKNSIENTRLPKDEWIHSLSSKDEWNLKGRIRHFNQIHERVRDIDFRQVECNNLVFLIFDIYNRSLKIFDNWNRICQEAELGDEWRISPIKSNQFIPIPFQFNIIDADQHALKNYFSFLESYPEYKNLQDDEKSIRIILNPKDIEDVRTKMYEKHFKNLYKSDSDEVRCQATAKEWSRIGIVYEDQYGMVVRDAALFPQGVTGTYIRFIWKNNLGKPCGAAVLPVIRENGQTKIVLCLAYHHATGWGFEIPRGFSKTGESGEEAAMREGKEEAGVQFETVTYLGSITPDSGILTSRIPLYLGKATQLGNTKHDKTEAIKKTYSFTVKEIEEALSTPNGKLMEEFIEDKWVEYTIQDSFFLSAFLWAKEQKLL